LAPTYFLKFHRALVIQIAMARYNYCLLQHSNLKSFVYTVYLSFSCDYRNNDRLLT